MKILRSVSRRGFSVGTAGWFTVLRPNTWFPASRLPKTFPSFGAQSAGAEERAADGEDGQTRAVRWLAMERTLETRHRVRAASAIFGAIAITTAMLWWIMHP